MSVTPKCSFQLRGFDRRSASQIQGSRYKIQVKADALLSFIFSLVSCICLYLCFTSSLSTVSNSNLISFHVSMAIFSSGLDCAALVRMALPSFSMGMPWLRASTQASSATRFAAAPAVFLDVLLAQNVDPTEGRLAVAFQLADDGAGVQVIAAGQAQDLGQHA